MALKCFKNVFKTNLNALKMFFKLYKNVFKMSFYNIFLKCFKNVIYTGYGIFTTQPVNSGRRPIPALAIITATAPPPKENLKRR